MFNLVQVRRETMGYRDWEYRCHHAEGPVNPVECRVGFRQCLIRCRGVTAESVTPRVFIESRSLYAVGNELCQESKKDQLPRSEHILIRECHGHRSTDRINTGYGNTKLLSVQSSHPLGKIDCEIKQVYAVLNPKYASLLFATYSQTELCKALSHLRYVL